MEHENQVQKENSIRIKSGRIVLRSQLGENETNSFSGYIRKIELFEGKINYNGEEVKTKQWKVYFESNEMFVWSVDYNSDLFFNFINSIHNVNDFNNLLELEPYFHINRNGLNVLIDGNRLRFHYNSESIPDVEPLYIDEHPLVNENGFQVYDYSKRSEFAVKMVEDIMLKLTGCNFFERVNGKSNAVIALETFENDLFFEDENFN